jgi:predicted metal-dependent phosphoesterase TrpH
VRFVIESLRHATGFHSSGGNLIDIVPKGRTDAFGGMGTWLDRTFPRQARYERVADGQRSLRVAGVDDGDPRIAVETTWIAVAPRSVAIWGRLLVRTEVRLQEGPPVSDYEVGDIVGWGALRAWGPGRGWDLRGWDGELPWLGAEGDGVAVLLVGKAPLEGPHGAAWSDPVWATLDLRPGEPQIVERELIVGRSLAEILDAACQVQDLPCVPAPGVARERGVIGVRGAEVTISRWDGAEFRPWVVGTTENVSGGLRPVLPEGRYRIQARSPSRPQLAAAEIAVDPGSERGPPLWEVQMAGPGRLRLEATGPDGAPIPARFDLRGRGGTPDPDLGPESHAIGRHRAYLLGPAELDLPPGSYHVLVSHGPLWSLHEADVIVPPLTPDSVPPAVHARLTPLVSSLGLRSCDLHLHSAWSADASVPPRDAVIAALGEGLDCIATTEHDVVADWTGTLGDLPAARSLLWLPGIEVTSRDQGHWNAYPWDPGVGVVLHRGKRPDAILKEMRRLAPGAVVQVNHPRFGRDGMFQVLDLGPDGLFRAAEGTSDDFDAVEVINGKHTEEAEEVLRDWERLLGRGLRTTLVGTSDSHRLVGQERGVARTWVRLRGDGGTEDVALGLKSRRETVASTGPLLRWSDDSQTLQVDRPAWMPLDRLELRRVGPKATTTVLDLRAPSPELHERRVGGRIEWRVTAPPGEGQLLAIVRGDRPMEPWMDCPAWAVSAQPKP